MCDCTKIVNEKLAEHNGRLATGFLIRGDMSVGSRLLLATEKLDRAKRKRVPHVTAAFCPFCGEKADA